MNDGGPAFPISVTPVPGVQEGGHEFGMTLRDYFAAKAMQGFVSNENLDGSYADYAKDAYALADAMLAAREAK